MKNLYCKKLAIPVVMFVFISCESKPHHPCKGSWEVSVNSGDTVNKTDCDGLKQGMWVPRSDNKLSDTMFYKNNVATDR